MNEKESVKRMDYSPMYDWLVYINGSKSGILKLTVVHCLLTKTHGVLFSPLKVNFNFLHAKAHIS